MEKWQNEVREWEKENLTTQGRYIGPDLVDIGFPYVQGDYVPITERHSAMLQFKWAGKCNPHISSERLRG